MQLVDNAQADSLSPADQVLLELKERWLIGDTAFAVAPQRWHASLCGTDTPSHKVRPGDEIELRLLTMAGQYQALLARPPRVPLQLRAPLPKLAHTTLSGKARTLFSRCIKRPGHCPTELLFLMARRGYVAHPLDWIPSSLRDKVPEIYHPWLIWLLSPNEDSPNQLSEENWNAVPAPLRLELLKQQLGEDRVATVELIERCCSGLPANEREKVLQLLDPDLQPDDLECLRAYEQDRSTKVQALVQRLIKALGEPCKEVKAPKNNKSSEHFQELLGMLKKSDKGIGPKRFSKEKRDKLQLRLWNSDPKRLAKHFKLTPLQLAKTWHFEQDVGASSSLMHAYVDNGLIREAMPLILQLAQRGEASACKYFIPRLTPKERDKLVRLVLQGENSSFVGLCRWLGDAYGTLPWSVAKKSAAYKDLLDCISRNVDTCKDDYSVEVVLQELALAIDHQGALACLEAFKKANMNMLDASLTHLHLNAALPPLN